MAVRLERTGSGFDPQRDSGWRVSRSLSHRQRNHAETVRVQSEIRESNGSIKEWLRRLNKPSLHLVTQLRFVPAPTRDLQKLSNHEPQTLSETARIK